MHKRQLLPLIGKLAFTCKVIPAGHIFLRQLFDTAHSMVKLELVTEDICKDIAWNGNVFFLEPDWTQAHEFQLFTNPAGTLSYGAFWNGHWFSEPWPAQLLHKSIQ